MGLRKPIYVKIVICDDNRQELDTIERMLYTHLDKQAPEVTFEIYKYQHPQQLLWELEDHNIHPDFYILDIDMVEMDGITLVGKIREYDAVPLFFFYTSHMEYATEGYKVEALRYIWKNGNAEAFGEAIDYSIEKCRQKQREILAIKNHNDVVRVPYSEIMYIQKDGDKVKITTYDGKQYFDNRGLKEVYDDINQPYFVYIDRSEFVNIHYVRGTAKNKLILFSDDELYISRRNIVKVKQVIAEQWQ